ncbi:TetR/AcrR family transcriptional regulator [Puerhibacterium puerhi]|uniref:TetR/AcrR family transcriptional regulator n=1 Tax=Puerhibacterium puerhi TaxID=2692623 RepID=UPI001358772D|nr:TetR/AcrR family transcriptional regulator [Puerhibacterium puerhi]
MGRTAGRTPQDTRRLVLDAAAEVIRTHGVAASLDVVAQHAGVSKGGLLYHFPSKDALVVALAQEMNEAFRGAVRAHVDPADAGPGRLTRAYVRASLAEVAEESEARERIALTAQLITVPAVARLAQEDTAWWERELAGDGLPPEAQAVVVAAADGISGAPLWGATPDQERLDLLRTRLLAMIDEAVAEA